MMGILTIEPVTGVFGGHVSNIDLSRPLSAGARTALIEALKDYKVLFFRDQALEPGQFFSLACSLGEPEGHHYYKTVDGCPGVSIIDSNTQKVSPDNVWHTDGVYRKTPPSHGLLQAIEVPDKGGDTMWADMEAAYSALTDRMQRLLDGLTAINDVSGGYDLDRRNLEAVQHPVVRRHPDTGRPCLYVNPTYTKRIVQLSPAESDAILAMLFKHTLTPEFHIRFRWQRHSVAIWDNRNTLHYAVADYAPSYRKMHRVALGGDAPF